MSIAGFCLFDVEILTDAGWEYHHSFLSNNIHDALNLLNAGVHLPMGKTTDECRLRSVLRRNLRCTDEEPL